MTTTTEPSPRYSDFKNELEKSVSAVEVFGKHIEGLGINVYVPPTRICPEDGDPKDYSDGGDIIAWNDNQIVEVKTTSYPFESRETWAFDVIALDPVEVFEAKNPTPLLYVVLPPSLRAAALIWVNWTRDFWKKKRIRHGRRGSRPLCYVIDKNNPLVEFISLEGLEGRIIR